jgi:hypothetical protein
VSRTTTDGVRSSLLQFMHEEREMNRSLGHGVYRWKLGPDVAGRVVYQLPIDGLLDSWARTTMPVMRTSQGGRRCIMLSGLFAVLLVGTLAGSVGAESGRDCHRTPCYPSYSQDYYGGYGYGAYPGCGGYRGYAGCDGYSGCGGYGRCGSYGDWAYGDYGGWSGR